MANPLKATLDDAVSTHPERIELARAEHLLGLSTGSGGGMEKTVQRKKGLLHLYLIPAWQTIVIESSYSNIKKRLLVPFNQFRFTEEFNPELEKFREEQRAMSKKNDELAKLERMKQSAKVDDTIVLT